MAARGLAAVLVLVAGACAVVAGGSGAFGADPVVTATLPAAAGPVRESSAVQYRGVRVGTIGAVEPGAGGSTLTLRMEPEQLDRVPAGVRVRLLPRTLFGDQYLDLAVPRGEPETGRLATGARLPADRTEPALRLYQVYTRAHRLVDALQPAQLQVALTALADSLRGRGERLGTMIDEASALAGESRPVLDHLGGDLRAAAALGEDLRAGAPDLVRSLDNAVALSDVVVQRRRNISDLMSGGADLTGRADRLLAENEQRTVQLVRSADPIAEVLAKNPDGLTSTKAGLDAFLDGANRAFATGFFEIRAKLSFGRPHPYGPQDCPRYPGSNGPNCGAAAGARPAPSGPIGPVGGPAELDAMRRLAPLLPPAGPRPPSPHMLGLLLGPVVRGSEVVVP